MFVIFSPNGPLSPYVSAKLLDTSVHERLDELALK